MVLAAKFTIQHKKYTGSTDVDGYPSQDVHDPAVSRKAYGWYPLSSVLNMTGDYDRRVITSKVLLVPDVGPYAPRDEIILPQPADHPEAERTYFVSEDVRDYSTGPFVSSTKGGEIILEKVTG